MTTRMIPTCSAAGCMATASRTTGRCPAHPKPARTPRPGTGRRWLATRGRVLRRDNWTCQHCGHRDVTGASLEVDHVLPVARGGSDELDNLRTLCRPCHRERTAADRRQGGGGASVAVPERTSSGKQETVASKERPGHAPA
jgi:5-methylcytosine-specific restriction endonuclease McrA